MPPKTKSNGVPIRPRPNKDIDKKLDKFGFIVNIDSNGVLREEVEDGKYNDVPTFAEAKRTERRTKKWNQMMGSWDTVRRRRTRLVLTRLRKGLPDAMRGQVWVRLGRVRSKIEVEHVGVYRKLLENADEASPHDLTSKPTRSTDDNTAASKGSNNHNSPGTTSTSQESISSSIKQIHDVIDRDIHRTYPRHNLFYEDETEASDTEAEGEGVLNALCNEELSSLINDLEGEGNNAAGGKNGKLVANNPQAEFANETQGHKALRRVLVAYSLYDREVGYCQGMNFIAAMFLTLMSEEEAFWLLVTIMQDAPCQMKGLFGVGMRETHKVLYIAEKVVNQFLPRLAKHFEKENIHVTMYATQWLLTQYTSSFNFDLVTRVWDAFLCEGWKITYRVMLAILQQKQSTLLKMSFEEILNYFREIPNQVDGPSVMETAIKIPLKKKHLKKYEKEWLAQEQNRS